MTGPRGPLPARPSARPFVKSDVQQSQVQGAVWPEALQPPLCPAAPAPAGPAGAPRRRRSAPRGIRGIPSAWVGVAQGWPPGLRRAEPASAGWGARAEQGPARLAPDLCRQPLADGAAGVVSPPSLSEGQPHALALGPGPSLGQSPAPAVQPHVARNGAPRDGGGEGTLTEGAQRPRACPLCGRLQGRCGGRCPHKAGSRPSASGV